ncbi:endonuclease/exonuclease/phosphatase family protein [Nonomuraea cavernae]|uniref:endonuclease/exonuclease/phosphatase family protein n=1 Tax=Nonomuraea cavernae TaxID=2045107 RepID=UPI00340FB99A
MISRIRVGTWNVHEGVTDHGDVLDEAVEHVLAERLDLLALQEVPFPEGSRSSPLLTELAERTRLRHYQANVLSPSWLVQGKRSGVAVASRFPIETAAVAVLPNPRLERGGMLSFDKGTVTARVRAMGRLVAMTSLHMPPFHRFGRRADDPDFGYIWDNLAKQLEPEEDEVTVIAGDFNTSHRRLLLRRIGADLETSVTGATRRGKAVDDIVHSASVARVSARVVRTFSDHCLCVAELDLG